MNKQKVATTNKITLIYNNGATYIIPRVYDFKVSPCGKIITGSYTKTTKEHGITLKHEIDFSIDLIDVVKFLYDARHGEVSSHYGVINGRINAKTEYRNEEDYYKPAKIGSVSNPFEMHKPFITPEMIQNLRGI